MPIAERPPSPETASFAGLLAALAAPRSGPRSGQSSWIDELEEDVATLSYEHALLRHSAPLASGTGTASQDSVANSGAPAFSPLFQPGEPAGDASPIATEAACGKRPGAAVPTQVTRDESRKRASVTVRMSRAESVRLQQRAAEAGLTVSAYLRSCAFEVETLRAQVKQTLAELRATQPVASPPTRWWQQIVRRTAAKIT
jgi:Mobilization protein NikA